MLKFAVFDSQGPAPAFTLRHAHVLGPDDVAVPADVWFESGHVMAQKRIQGTAALALQYPVASGGGVLTLRTCLLPDRDRPYLLPLELARRQILLLLNKLEEWALFDQPSSEPALVGVQKALDSFTHALVAQNRATSGGGYSLESSQAATQALHDTLLASEALALLAARVQHTKRVSGELARLAAAPPPPNALTDHESKASRAAVLGSVGKMLPETPKVGAGISAGAFTPELTALAGSNLDFISLPMRWVDMEPVEGKYAFVKTDRWIEWAVTKAKVPVVAGPVLDLSPACVPEWLYIWEHDYETLRDVVFEHVKTIVTRYRRTVSAWTVCSGLHAPGALTLLAEQALDLTRGCALLVKKLQPAAKVIIEISQPWGEHTAMAGGAKTIPPMLYCEWLNQLPVQYDYLGLRLQMGQPQPGQSARDLMALSAVLDRYAQLDRPIAVTCMGVPSAPPPPLSTDQTADVEDLDPGYWHEEWSPSVQARWAAQVGAIVASKPYVVSLSWQDLFDPSAPKDGEMPAGGLASLSAAPKPALKAFRELRQALRDRRATLPEADRA